jgi:hypothetical protein
MLYMETLKEQHIRRLSEKLRTDSGTSIFPQDAVINRRWGTKSLLNSCRRLPLPLPLDS